MFKDEILKSFSNVKVAWYPKEKLCLVVKRKSTRTYNKIPQKYIVLFKDKGIKLRNKKNANRIRN